ncbi:MAG TPA: VOC family protein [Anaerolineae bacterium]|nr:VOC family protein [Anaerolineae bacterium]
MDHYVPSNEQLVVELYVQDIERSKQFYQELGFDLIRAEPNFAVLGWESSRLLLAEIEGQPAPPSTVVANVRIMVPHVDRYWHLAQRMGLDVLHPIDDRYYGLRDFTVRSPDGIALRFATRIVNAEPGTEGDIT